jgi:hypothetical protein
MRLRAFLGSVVKTRDISGAMIFGLAAAVMVWLCAMPICPAIQRATIDRFHFASPNFATWAALQVIPPMYNLENQYWYYGVGGDLDARVSEPDMGRQAPRDSATDFKTGDIKKNYFETGRVNHFPSRMLTFFDNRARLLETCPEGNLVIESRYQNQSRVTVWEIKPDGTGATTMIRRQEPNP